MKVLLFSNDTMPFGTLPTSGGGLRCWQLYQGLRSQGIEVIASMPAFTFLTQKYFSEIPEEVRANLWEWHTQDDIFERNKPDAVIFASNWDHYNLRKKPDVPLIVDLHGSRLIETALFGDQADCNKKVDVFSRADLLLSAGKRQRNYFYGWLTQAGRVPECDHFIRYIPVSLGPENFVRNDLPPSSINFPLIVSGGGWFPWQDQSKAIFQIARYFIEKKKGKLQIYGTPHDNPSPSPEELAIRRIFASVEDLSTKHGEVDVVGYVGRDDLLKEYSKASVALELMTYNLERELAFTTRTIEYLWCGLPVIYNNYSEISDHISEYDAGWTIDPGDSSALKLVLDEIMDNPEIIRSKSRNAQQLARERFSWDKTINPLVDFLKNPVISKELTPCISFVGGRASYLTPGGSPLEIPLSCAKDESIEMNCKIRLSQRFIFPTEGVWALEVPYQLEKSIGEITLKVKSKYGFTISKRRHLLSVIPKHGTFLLPLSRIFRPLGGSAGILEIVYEGVSGGMLLNGLLEPVYPLLESAEVSSFVARDSLGRESRASVLKFQFHAGASRTYHLRSMIERAYWLIRQGQIKRLVRAVLRRMGSKKTAVLRKIISLFKSLRFHSSAQKV
ncbi:MAG TPA: glycosyltransferase family 4 protein [Oligoflexia bacterium]|nr:glycosyltransferase family 4 protein [Oligoflexia bacterium]HMP47705.1 glycosyltransferase family 4 protein [Oligoflexia bacterium]